MTYREQYDTLAAEIATIKTSLDALAIVVSNGNSALSNWRTAALANTGEAEFPDVLPTHSRRAINIGDWPSGKDIADKLRRYHQLKTQLLSAYSRLSSEDKAPHSTVKPPDTLL